MKKRYLVAVLLTGFLFFTIQAHAQQVDSAAMVKSQKSIAGKLDDAEKLQRKINKKQNRIEKKQRKIGKNERKRERKMKGIEKEQDKMNNALPTE